MKFEDIVIKSQKSHDNYFLKNLYPFQDKVLNIFMNHFSDVLYFTGGTALSRIYFNHRYSDDLDFFTNSDELILIIDSFINKLKKNNIEVETTKRDRFHSVLFVSNKVVKNMKIDFAYSAECLDDPVIINHLRVNTLKDLAANKIIAYQDRVSIKDLIDLYFLNKHFSPMQMLNYSEKKFTGLEFDKLKYNNDEVNFSNLKTIVTKNIDFAGLRKFVAELKSAVEIKIKKKAKLVNPKKVISKLLWDFPKNERKLTVDSYPVIKRRYREYLNFPEQIATRKSLIKWRNTHTLPDNINIQVKNIKKNDKYFSKLNTTGKVFR